MWEVNGTKIKVAEGDYGVELPVTISGTTLTSQDTLRFTFKDDVGGTTILEKEFTPTNNAINFELTEAEGELFTPGVYAYKLDWYQDGVFMCNLIPVGLFVVVKTA